MHSMTIKRPDDWHIHLRDGAYLAATVAHASRYFGRALVMPNLTPPVVSVAAARAYKDRIEQHLPPDSGFTPLLTLYLTNETSQATLIDAKQADFIHACKLYPAGATTNSEQGVHSIDALFPLFEAMEKYDLPLSIHGEVADDEVDIFDREAVFIDRYLSRIVARFPGLRIVLEHITTQDAVAFVSAASGRVGATVTAHHLLYNRNDMLAGSMKPVYFCLPILKRSTHQEALVRAVTSGNPAFFLGTDSAPHPGQAKENACGCDAGCYTAHAALELYAEVFAAEACPDKLEGFASQSWADFYQLPRNQNEIELVEESWQVPAVLDLGQDTLVPIRAGDTMRWRVRASNPAVPLHSTTDKKPDE